MKIKCSYSNLVDIDKLMLLQNPKNNNKHSSEQIERLAKIIDFAGQRSPIVVSNRSGFIIKGHGRLLAIHKLGWSQAAVDYQDYQTEAEEYQDMTADNQIAKWAEFDEQKFLIDAKELDLGDYELLGLTDLQLSNYGLIELDSYQQQEVKNTSKELNQNDFNNFDNKCPKCGFEFNDKEEVNEST